MLQALELNGFKSFADRTRLEFPAGITVVVGPNGSGKSNVVDAVKWVLGAQSVKALRGKEMTDVIFSGSPKRRAAGAAEVSLIFDNRSGALGHDADSLQITRRVYRSSESEYLINGKSCRLRDVRDVLAGTGMAGGAYSIIEQGKVDALLQSSPADRRQIFEEAAGISRFKQKRQEAARRLERVQQNLLRLTDIVEELQSRLATVRSQAGRARKYKDVHARLRELQVRLAIADWRTTAAEINRLTELSENDQQQIAAVEERLAECERDLRQHDDASERLQADVQDRTAAAAAIRERIAHCETSRSSQLARVEELRQETQRLAAQLLAMNTRAGDSQQLVEQARAELQAAEEAFAKLQAATSHNQQELAELEGELAQLQHQEATLAAELNETERSGAQLENRAELLAAKLETSRLSVGRRHQEVEELTATQSELAAKLEQAVTTLDAAENAHTAATAELKQAQTQLRRDQRSLAQLQKQHAELQGRLTGARERTVVLEELEKRLDGLSAGTKEVLRRAEQNPEGPFGTVRGVVADLLRVDADMAQLIEIALGESANHLVVADARALSETLASESLNLPARTVFLRLDIPLAASAVDRVELAHEPGVVGRADQFVETDAELEALAKRLLGRYWFVDSLETALRLSTGLGRGLSFVTVDGEVVTAEGLVAVGPRKQSSGLLSRRNELRALEEQVVNMQAQLEADQARCQTLETKIADDDLALQRYSETHDQARSELHAAQLSEASLRERYDQTVARLTAATEQQQSAARQNQRIEAELHECRERLAEGKQRISEIGTEVVATREQRGEQEAALAEFRSQATEERVACAGSEQRRDGLLRQVRQLEREHQERRQNRNETHELITQGRRQIAALTMQVLDLTTEIAELYRQKQTLTEQLGAFQQRQTELRAARQQTARAADALRQTYLQRQKRGQQLQLQLQQAEHSRTGLSDRLREAYKIELAIVARQSPAEPIADDAEFDREALDREVQQLQSQMHASGPVNLEAVEELESLEARYKSLAEQHDDLQTARASLEKIVGQINVESRQLFAQTIDEVRIHFQELFKNLFGGGEADIVVESDSEDVMECGIEIVARPPGKQPRSISLLSGGERTMTCVALLLAIFKSRPSPFCVLDEVDAALDEANVERFTEVLKEFMGSTQFIVITHSKRTMTCSDTLYGVTMQESGVSKQVSVRFEDVTEDGHIKPAALKRAA